MQSEKDKSDALIEELYPKLYPYLVSYATSATHDRAVAEELAQEAFVVACEHPSKFASSENPTGWLIKTLRNLLCNYGRSRALWAELLKTDSEDEAANVPSTDPVRIKTMYGGIIPDSDLDLIIAVEISGYTYKEAGLSQGITAEACRKRVKRAEQLLAEKLKKSGAACPHPAPSAHNNKGGLSHVE